MEKITMTLEELTLFEMAEVLVDKMHKGEDTDDLIVAMRNKSARLRRLRREQDL